MEIGSERRWASTAGAWHSTLPGSGASATRRRDPDEDQHGVLQEPEQLLDVRIDRKVQIEERGRLGNQLAFLMIDGPHV